MHEMQVQTKYYNLLKKGIKTIELRLLDEKRRKLHIGDIVKFIDSSNKNNFFTACIINLHRFKTFKELSNSIDIEKCGFKSEKTLLQTLGEFYPLKKQLENGVLGIEIEKV